MAAKIFITSDTFFGRASIIELANRPFKSVEEMDATLIENWNNVVSENDIVYHLGNFAWSPIVADNVLKQLNGTIKFILGDFDDALKEVIEYYQGLDILPNDIFKDYKHKIVLSHWPLLDWPGKDRGVYHFHGHNFNTMKTDLTESNRINISTDFWKYTPQELKSLFATFKDFKKMSNEKV